MKSTDNRTVTLIPKGNPINAFVCVRMLDNIADIPETSAEYSTNSILKNGKMTEAAARTENRKEAGRRNLKPTLFFWAIPQDVLGFVKCCHPSLSVRNDSVVLNDFHPLFGVNKVDKRFR